MIKRIKKWEYSIKTIVSVYNRTLDFKSLFDGYVL